MNVFSSGTVKQLDDVPIGSCFGFSVHGETRIGMMVQFGENQKGILDFEAEGMNKSKYPAVYKLDHFRNELVMHYPEARIVLASQPEFINFGYHESGKVTKAVYIVNDKFVVQASRDRHVQRFDLSTGLSIQCDIGNALHTVLWRIEVPNADDDYVFLIEFAA